MEGSVRHDLRINGDGSASGGNYNNATINGNGQINGDLDCVNFICNGNADLNGSIKAKSIKVNGHSNFSGSVAAESMQINGNFLADGDVSGGDIKINGFADIKGNLSGERIKQTGAITVQGDCNAESFATLGGFTIGGLLNADSIDINLHYRCQVTEMGGARIEVKSGREFQLLRIIKAIFNPGNHALQLVSDIIEGDEIHLEQTRAKVVRGNNVTIGKNCQIDLVEYRNSFQQAENAAVKNSAKI